MINLQNFSEDCLLIREQSPLVHNITNYVAMNIAANGLLAIGASPLMSFYEKEMDEIAQISSALVINIGCLDDTQIAGMRAAAEAFHRLGKPWILDPVGVGASKVRTQTALELIRNWKPDIIRGNASEILCLAGERICSRGVDASCSSNDAIEAAKVLALNSGAVISMSGGTDYITDGQRVETIRNGSPLMAKVTAMGCTASALTGAFAAVSPHDAFRAALHTMALMGTAGEIALSKSTGTGSLAVNFIDALNNFNPLTSSKLIRQ